LIAASGGVEIPQTVSLTVPPCQPVTLTSSGCGATGAPAFLGAALVWLAVRVRRRRGRS
jgi:uncharacterized protein (TIGR03382 family)